MRLGLGSGEVYVWTVILQPLRLQISRTWTFVLFASRALPCFALPESGVQPPSSPAAWAYLKPSGRAASWNRRAGCGHGLPARGGSAVGSAGVAVANVLFCCESTERDVVISGSAFC